jgi:sodium/myo-inositol cotransporter 3
MEEYETQNRLTIIDIIIVIFYFMLLIGVSFYSMFKHNRSTVKGYFLANRQMSWLCIGASLFASNIGAEHFIGLASSGAAEGKKSSIKNFMFIKELCLGLSIAAFELTAISIVQLLGWVFLPVFITTGVSTLPEYMNRRFGGQRIRVYIASLYLLLYILTKISVNIYASSLFINYAFSWNTYTSILFILVLTGLCTISGGLASVIYTDTIQAIIMIIGGLIVMILSYREIGGVSNLYRRYLNATPTLTDNDHMRNLTTLGTCGRPTMKSFQMLRSISDPDMPWLGFFLGHTPTAIWYWCSDQMMVQRVLAAKNISHARGGTLLAGYLKILPLFMIIIPGMISRVLYPNIVACNQPSICQSICNSKRSCSNIAYPTLILKLLPDGLKGMMIAVMLAALISGLTSVFNSASTIFTVDLYPNIFAYRQNKIKTRELMIVGRLFVIFMTIAGIVWIPVVIKMQGSEIYIYMQQVTGFFAPPIACVFILAVLWTRTNESGAFAGLMVGFSCGMLRMILEFSKQPSLCGEEDTRFWFIRRIHFLYYAMFLFWITFLTCVSVSLCTKPPTKEQLFRTTYWTRYQKSDTEIMTMNEKSNGVTSILR